MYLGAHASSNKTVLEQEESQQTMPWATSSLQAFESQGGIIITVDK